jgi:hypothetical protein
MKNILSYLVKQMVDHPEDINITETTQNERTILTLKVNPEDMGKIIGKQGRIIRSLRDLVKLVAAKKNIFVDIILAE